MLNTSNIIGFVATAHPEEALEFYQNALGLELREDGPYALVFAVNGTTIRVQKVPKVVLTGYTSLGWDVKDIKATVTRLSKNGVRFERYEGMGQDEAGIWHTPNGSYVAWFRDPDGNILSLTQHA